MIDIFQKSIDIHKDLLDKQKKLEELDIYRIDTVDYSNIKVSPTNNHSSSIENILIKQEELQSQWVKASYDELKVHNEIEKYIDTLLDPMERIIIRYRYIFHWSWKKIENKTGYSTRQLQRIHKSVLDNYSM